MKLLTKVIPIKTITIKMSTELATRIFNHLMDAGHYSAAAEFATLPKPITKDPADDGPEVILLRRTDAGKFL